MTRFRVAVHIVPRKGILDPQGKAVADALHALAFSEVGDVRIGRHMLIDVDASNDVDAGARVRRMCDKLLANPVTEDYEIAGVQSL
jgi:phosphoribosylformylglycinamidine synthase PurS subunit